MAVNLASENECKTLWMGAVQPHWDESFVFELFAHVGDVEHVKVIRNANSGLPSGYAFIDFASHDTAERVLSGFNGQPIPGTNVVFRLNWGSGGIQKVTGKEHSLFVGDLSPEVTDPNLLQFFASAFPTTTSAKVITDAVTGQSKGYGFVRFSDLAECELALERMNGRLLGTRPIRVHHATAKRSNAWANGDHGDGTGDVLDVLAQPLQPVDFSNFDDQADKVENAASDLPPDAEGAPSAQGHWNQSRRQQHQQQQQFGVRGRGGARYAHHYQQQQRRMMMMQQRQGSEYMGVDQQMVDLGLTGDPRRQQTGGRGAVVAAAAAAENAGNTTVFVGNLDASVTEPELAAHFRGFGTIASVKIPIGKGCGFVRFFEHESSAAAISALHGSLLGGNAIRLDWGKNHHHHSHRHSQQLRQLQQHSMMMGGDMMTMVGSPMIYPQAPPQAHHQQTPSSPGGNPMYSNMEHMSIGISADDLSPTHTANLGGSGNNREGGNRSRSASTSHSHMAGMDLPLSPQLMPMHKQQQNAMMGMSTMAGMAPMPGMAATGGMMHPGMGYPHFAYMSWQQHQYPYTHAHAHAPHHYAYHGAGSPMGSMTSISSPQHDAVSTTAQLAHMQQQQMQAQQPPVPVLSPTPLQNASASNDATSTGSSGATDANVNLNEMASVSPTAKIQHLNEEKEKDLPPIESLTLGNGNKGDDARNNANSNSNTAELPDSNKENAKHSSGGAEDKDSASTSAEGAEGSQPSLEKSAYRQNSNGHKNEGVRVNAPIPAMNGAGGPETGTSAKDGGDCSSVRPAGSFVTAA